MNRFRIDWALPMLLLGTLLFLSGCSKDEDDYQLTVVVVADDNVRVANSLVRVYAPVDNSFIDFFANTNEQGEADFTFSNEVVLDIIASKGSFVGCDFAQVKQGENTVKVEIRVWGTDDNGCPETTP